MSLRPDSRSSFIRDISTSLWLLGHRHLALKAIAMTLSPPTVVIGVPAGILGEVGGDDLLERWRQPAGRSRPWKNLASVGVISASDANVRVDRDVHAVPGKHKASRGTAGVGQS